MPVYVIDTLKPKNGLDFAVVEAIDVAVEGYLNLADAVTHFATQSALAELTAALSDKADTSDITNLQSQIDQIVISASAEAVVAPEVAQARVDVNGIEHSTLKDRSDSDYNMLALATEFDNLFDSAQALDNQRLMANGATENNEGYYTSAKINVNDNVDYVKYGAEDTGHRVCFYDANDTFIDATTESSFKTPEGTTYIRFSGLMREKSIAYFHSVSAKDQNSRNNIVKVDEKYAYNTAALSKEVSDIENTVFDKQDKAVKISDIFAIVPKTGYSASPTTKRVDISANALFDTYYLITKKAVSIWVESASSPYYAIIYGKDFIRTATTAGGSLYLYCSGETARLRNSDGNLPTVNNKLTLPANTIIAITVTVNTDPYILGFDYSLLPKDSFVDNIASVAADEAVSELTEETEKVYTNNSQYDNVYDGYYAAASGLVEMENYISWGFTVSADTEMYVQSKNGTYFSIN